MATLSEVGVRLVARTGQFERGMMKASKTLTSFRRAALAVLGIGSLAQTVRGLSDTGAEIKKVQELTKQFDVTATDIQKLAFAFRESGVEMSEFIGAMEDMVGKVSEAARGVGPAVDDIKALGVSAEQLAQMGITEQMFMLADAFHAMANGTREGEAASGLFSDTGQRLLKQLNDGSGALREQMALFEKLGGVIDDSGTEQVVTFTRRLGLIGGVWDGLKKKVVEGISSKGNAIWDTIVGGGKFAAGILRGDGFVESLKKLDFEAKDFLWGGLTGGVTKAISRGLDDAKIEMEGVFNEETRKEEDRIAALKARQRADARRVVQEDALELYKEITGGYKPPPTSTGQFEAVNLANVALNNRASISGGRPQEVKDPTLDVVVDVLRQILAKSGSARAA